MFRGIVRRQYRRAWAAMNAHDYKAILAQLALPSTSSSSATHRFVPLEAPQILADEILALI